MKHKQLIFSIIALSIAFASCKKSYLNRDPYNAVPLASAIQSESDLSVALNGVYSSLRNTDLFGRTLPVKGDLMADNTFVTTANSNRYITLNTFTIGPADAYALAIWSNGYVVIKNANTVIKGGTALPGSTNAPTESPQYLWPRSLRQRGWLGWSRFCAGRELVRSHRAPKTCSGAASARPQTSNSLRRQQISRQC